MQEAKAAEEKTRREQEVKAAEERALQQESKRVALVIGNSNYASRPLDTPKNDADDITAALQRLHFDVAERKDLLVRDFDQAIDTFEAKAKDADVALFFFSGHGVQIDKRGYLAPIDVNLESESSALRGLESIQEVVSRIENSAKVSVIVIDACRDSPLQDHLRRIAVAKNRALLPPKGLPPVSIVGSNTLIVYATVPGETAIDGDGRNSPFSAALLRHIETPGLEIELMFKHVTADVLRATGGKQQPERLSRLQNELVLLPAMSGAMVQAPLSADMQAWIAVQSTTSEAVLEEFVRRFSGSTFAGFAKARLDELKKGRLALSRRGAGEIREFRVGDIDSARRIIRILRAKVRPSGGPRGLQERLPDLQLAAQGIQRLRKALPDILAKAADALSPRMKRIIETLAADWRRLDERVDEVSTGIAGAEGGSCQRLLGIGHYASDLFQSAACGAKVSWLARSGPCSMLKWAVISGLADVSFLCIAPGARHDGPDPRDSRFGSKTAAALRDRRRRVFRSKRTMPETLASLGNMKPAARRQCRAALNLAVPQSLASSRWP